MLFTCRKEHTVSVAVEVLLPCLYKVFCIFTKRERSKTKCDVRGRASLR